MGLMLVSRCSPMRFGHLEGLQLPLPGECSDSCATEVTEPCHVSYGDENCHKRHRKELDSSPHWESPSQSDVDADATTAERRDKDEDTAGELRKKQRKSHRRVSFADALLEFAFEEHADDLGQQACPPSWHCSSQQPLEALTKENLLAMVNELGEEFMEANAQSIVRLKRRV
jgi:hypothetical protein